MSTRATFNDTSASEKSEWRRRGSRRSAFTTFVLVVMFLVVGSAVPDTVTAAVGSTVIITERVTPANVTIAAGDSVRFVNNDGDRHRMRSTSGPAEFDTGDIEAGAALEVVLTRVGTYPYEDRRQSGNSAFTGTITVMAEPAPTPTPTPEPSPQAPTDPAPTTSSVSILDRSFSPASVSISAGSTVVWTNVSGRDHNVAANDGSFASADLGSGATYSKTFTTPGTFNYFCTIHPDMVAVVAVGAANQPPPPAPAPPPPTATPPPTPTSGTADPNQPSSAPATGAVNIVDYAYDPATTSIRAGDTLVWTNFGRAPHTVTAKDQSFDSGTLAPGGTYSRTFTSPGTFTYFCTIHPEMQAVVAVGAAGDAPPATPPSPPPPTSSSTNGARASSGGSIQMIDYGYGPSTYSARVGDRVVWSNAGLAPHTATARDGSFDTGLVAAGASGSVRLTKAGTFAYFCTIHPQMSATLKVAEAPPGTVIPDADEGLADPDADLDATAPVESVPGHLAASVGVIDFDYDPDPLVVQAGTTVTWEWIGLSPHTVTDEAGSFDSGILVKGDTWSRTFDEIGTIQYLCTLHPDMKGSIEVVATEVAATPSRPTGDQQDGTSPLARGGTTNLTPGTAALALFDTPGSATHWVEVLTIAILTIAMLAFGAWRFFKRAAAEQAQADRRPAWRSPTTDATLVAATGPNYSDGRDEHLAKWILGGLVAFLVLITLPLMAVGVVAVATADSPEGLQARSATIAEASLAEFTITGRLNVPEGPVSVTVTNQGSIEHNLAVRELTLSTRDLEPGSSAELDLGQLTAGTYELYCTLPGHVDAGMKSTLTVLPGSPESVQS